jgi:hypothetical protein
MSITEGQPVVHDESHDDDDDDDCDDVRHLGNKNELYLQPERREHHNELERRRRDHIKDSFDRVKQRIPSMSGTPKVIRQLSSCRQQIPIIGIQIANTT